MALTMFLRNLSAAILKYQWSSSFLYQQASVTVHVGLVVGTGLLEATEIVRPQQLPGSQVHSVEVQVRELVEPREFFNERVLTSMQKIRIFALCCAEAGMEVIAYGLDASDGYAGRQDGI